MRYQTEMLATRHIVDALYMHLLKLFIDRIDININTYYIEI